MIFQTSHRLLAAAALMLPLAAALPASAAAETDRRLTEKERQVVDLLKAIETGAPGPVAVINPDKYIQHNLGVADGLAGFTALVQALPKGSVKVNTLRVFEDGDFVVAHTAYEIFGPKIGFDVFRFENGRIVEHWDNLQETAGPNAGGNTMTDGPTAPTDLGNTEANKKLVRAFVDDILVSGRMAKLAGYFDGDNYIQHNPLIANGLSGLGQALEAMAKAGVTLKYDRIHRVLGKGDLVFVASEGSLGGKPTAFFDLFRVANGKIAEHWDTVQAIPPKAEWKNQNGKF